MSTFSFYAAAAAIRQISAVSATMSVGSAIYGVLYFIFMSAVILGAAYYVTKYIARKGLNQASNKNLKIIETIHLGVDRGLILVKVGEQYLLLGSTQKSITLLTAIEQDKLSVSSISEASKSADGENIESYMDKLQDEDESVSSIKRNLNRLKSIVRGNKTDV